MDSWDPKITNGFAAEHDVIFVDYPGIAGSSGETPSTVVALTKNCAAFCRVIGLTHFDSWVFHSAARSRSSSAPNIRTWSGGLEAAKGWSSTISRPANWMTYRLRL
jgi:hypothetical protein